MIAIKKEGIILSETDLEFENEGVLNPAIMQDGNMVHLFYRAVRRGNNSTIGYAKLDGPLKVIERNKAPLIIPTTTDEIHGIEDPRIVKIDNVYYMTYCAYDGINARGSYATSLDLTHFIKQGVIVPQVAYSEFRKLTECSSGLNKKYGRFHIHNPIKTNRNKESLVWDKNLVFFPKLINGKFTSLHRIKPDIQIVSVKNINDLSKEFWSNYLLHFKEHTVLTFIYEHENSFIGCGYPAVETKAGWILIYHDVHDTSEGYVYCACACLLGLIEPSKEIARLPYALFKPDMPYELLAYVNNVVFPTGASIFNNRLYIYYGASDKQIAVASLSLKELISELLKFKN